MPPVSIGISITCGGSAKDSASTPIYSYPLQDINKGYTLWGILQDYVF